MTSIITISKTSTGISKKKDDILKLLSSTKFNKKTVKDSISAVCNLCFGALELSETNYICSVCGLFGDTVETVQPAYSSSMANNYSYDRFNSYSNGACNTLNDNGNNMYDLILTKLLKCQNRSSTAHIPTEVLRTTARTYAEICSRLKELIATESGGVKSSRCGSLLPAILKQSLDKNGTSRTDSFISGFLGKSKGKGKGSLTKSENKYNDLMKKDISTYYRVETCNKLSSYAYQFLARLNVDTSLSVVVVQIIKRCNVQIDMIDFRTCQDETKVVGTIYLILRQIGLNIHHDIIKSKCFDISKSTYVRFMKFLDYNRKKINPILLSNKPLPIRPIPRIFANHDNNRRSEKLSPLAEEYKGKYMQHSL